MTTKTLIRGGMVVSMDPQIGDLTGDVLIEDDKIVAVEPNISADADVIYAGNGMTGYGNVVILRHDQQMTSLYAHNSELKVKQGEHVKQGTLIALLGSTGRSTGPHVHFEIREGDAPINPRVILPEAKLGESTQHTPTRVAHADD